MNFEEMVQKIVNAKSKAGLKYIIMIRDLDICYSQDYCPSNNIALKVQIQRIIAKDSSYPKKPKTKDPKSAFLRDNIVEPAKKKNNQMKFKYRQKCTKKPKKNPATGNKIIDATKKKKKRAINKVTCFNCNQKDYYITTAPSQKTSVSLGKFHASNW